MRAGAGEVLRAISSAGKNTLHIDTGQGREGVLIRGLALVLETGFIHDLRTYGLCVRNLNLVFIVGRVIDGGRQGSSTVTETSILRCSTLVLIANSEHVLGSKREIETGRDIATKLRLQDGSRSDRVNETGAG